MFVFEASHSDGDGRVVVGRFEVYRDLAGDYLQMEMDELMFFNQELALSDSQMLYEL